MDNYDIAWLVVAVCALLGGLALHRLFRSAHPLLRWLVIVVAVVFFLTPANIPNYPGYLAPAFVIFIFEALFQTEGEPLSSLRVLGIAEFAGILATVTLYFIYARLTGSSARQADSAGE